MGQLSDRLLGGGKTLSLPLGFGIHDLTLVVRDSHGVPSSHNFEVEVGNSRIDSIVLPPDRYVTWSDPAGAVVSLGTVSATDNCSGVVEITHDAPTGFQFPPGLSLVQWTFDDYRGNVDSHTQRVVVTDPAFHPQPLCTITVPPSITIGQVLEIHHNTHTQGRAMAVDEYITILTPDGRDLDVDPSGSLVETAPPSAHATGRVLGIVDTHDKVYSGVLSDTSAATGTYLAVCALVTPGGSPDDPATVLSIDWRTFELTGGP